MFELPDEITGPSAWYGPQLATRTDWIHLLNDAEIAEIDSATRKVEEAKLEPTKLRREDFPLLTLGPL